MQRKEEEKVGCWENGGSAQSVGVADGAAKKADRTGLVWWDQGLLLQCLQISAMRNGV